MKVWINFGGWPDEPREILGVYSSEALAIAASRENPCNCVTEEHEVITE